MRNGSTTVLIPNRVYIQPIRVWKIILKYGVNTLVWIPSMLSLFANYDILAHVQSAPLRTVLFCGEVMPVKQLNYWISQYPDVTFVNMYGPTEATEACTYYTINRRFADDDVLPIGVACKNSQMLVLDQNDSLIIEPNQVGELCIRGTCLSIGYYGNHDKTAEAFIQNPLQDHYPEIIYRTGDLVCYNDYHELVYVSRKDFQIKHRGYRIELGEVDAAASAIPGVEYCCCLYDANKDQLHLVYTGGIAPNEGKMELAERLQAYMIPSIYHQRKAMLFNLNGKIDRKALTGEYIKQL